MNSSSFPAGTPNAHFSGLSFLAPQAIENLLEIFNEVIRVYYFDYHIISIGFHALAPVVT
jgi:hypothetical protein